MVHRVYSDEYDGLLAVQVLISDVGACSEWASQAWHGDGLGRFGRLGKGSAGCGLGCGLSGCSSIRIGGCSWFLHPAWFVLLQLSRIVQIL